MAGNDIQLLSMEMSSNMAVAALTWERGIHGARRWTRPLILSGRRNATARAYVAPRECPIRLKCFIDNAWHTSVISSGS